MQRTLRHTVLPSRWVIALVGVLALLLSSCAEDETQLEEAEEEGQAEALVGETITVSGEIGEVLTTEAVVLNSDFVSFGLERGTLVYSLEEGFFTELSEGDFIQVTGTVDEFLVNEFDAGVFDEDVFADFDDEFAIEAQSFEFVSESVAEGEATEPAAS